MKFIKIICSALSILCFAGCQKESKPSVTRGPEENQRYYVNIFAFNAMNTYYLWNGEISAKLDTWMTNDNPVDKVDECRYKDENGRQVDRWTTLTDNYKEFMESLNGTSTTSGFGFTLYYKEKGSEDILIVVDYVTADSPASKASLKRGDAICRIDGQKLTTGNYVDIIKGKVWGNKSYTASLISGKDVNLTPCVMYEEPVNEVKVIELGGKKAGYMHYTSFTAESCARLIEAADYFKEQCIDEMVLDLRYNGGGFNKTEQMLATLLVSPEPITNHLPFLTEIYNSILSKHYNSKEYFETSYDFILEGKHYGFDIKKSLLGLKRLYVLVGSGSASASEALISGLMPHMDVITIGTKTHGKFCSGIVLNSNEWYSTNKDNFKEQDMYSNGIKYADNWGLYVMIGRYCNAEGKTPSMPDGITPDYIVEDDPAGGIQLGDPDEPLLSKALELAGMKSAKAATPRKKNPGAISFGKDDYTPSRVMSNERILLLGTSDEIQNL